MNFDSRMFILTINWFIQFYIMFTYAEHVIRQRCNAKCDNRSASNSTGKCTNQYGCDWMC